MTAFHIKAPAGAWFFRQDDATGTVLVVEPGGEQHVVIGGDMNSAKGRELLAAMVRALSQPHVSALAPAPAGPQLTPAEAWAELKKPLSDSAQAAMREVCSYIDGSEQGITAPDARDAEIAGLEASVGNLGRLVDELRPDAERWQAVRLRHACALVARFTGARFDSEAAPGLLDQWADRARTEVAEWEAKIDAEKLAWYITQAAAAVAGAQQRGNP